MNRSPRWLLAAGATLALGLAAAPAATADSTSTSTSTTSATTTVSSVVSDSAARAERFGIDRLPVSEALQSAIDGTQYTCGPTDFDTYINKLLASMTPADFAFLRAHPAALDVPTYDALLFGTTSDARYNLRSDYKQSVTKTFTDVKRFWDIQSSDIQLISMHGEMLKDASRVARTLQVFGYSPEQAKTEADEIAAGISSGLLGGGTNPLFTLNAFAFSASEEPADSPFKNVPDKLVFGDGIVDALNAMGLGDVGPRAVLGHEFGHHVQFEDHLFNSPLTGPEATRRTELMADAFGTYFTVHARGLALNTKRVLQVEKSFYEVGDCAFTNDGHHGTPLQREASSTWAANLANSARPQGYILPSLQFDKLFEAELPKLVAPTAS